MACFCWLNIQHRKERRSFNAEECSGAVGRSDFRRKEPSNFFLILPFCSKRGFHSPSRSMVLTLMITQTVSWGKKCWCSCRYYELIDLTMSGNHGWRTGWRWKEIPKDNVTTGWTAGWCSMKDFDDDSSHLEDILCHSFRQTEGHLSIGGSNRDDGDEMIMMSLRILCIFYPCILLTL